MVENSNQHQGRQQAFFDPIQNDFADTPASAYSVRPHYLPAVSTPLSWKEFNSKLAPHQFTINTIVSRIKKKSDLLKDLFSRKLN